MEKPIPTTEKPVFQVDELERIEFSATRLADGTINWNMGIYQNWPEVIIVAGTPFRLIESDDDDHYTPASSPEGSMGTMAWYEPETPEKT